MQPEQFLSLKSYFVNKLRSLEDLASGHVLSVAFSPDGKRAATVFSLTPL
jgi:hypothetical protein